jgi:hypothetical protein
MSSRFVVGNVILVAAAFFACSGNRASYEAETQHDGTTPQDGGSESSSVGAVGGLPCDVDAILAKHCRDCHGMTPRFGAPMSLVSLADLKAPSKSDAKRPVYEQVESRIHDDAHPMPQPPNARLEAADLATIDSWVAAGAPAGDSTCRAVAPASDAGATGVDALDCTPDQRLRPTTPYTVTDKVDEYVCFGFDTNATTKRHLIAGAAHIDNTKVVHHLLVYQTPDAVSGTPAPCSPGGGSGWRLITGWAPGNKNFELPPEAGFAEDAGTTHWAVQIHYNNASALAGEVDSTGYDFCSTDKLRPNDADVFATGTMSIDIKPRSTHTTTCTLSVPSFFGKFKVVGAWPHMHRLGVAQYAKRVRGGADTTILDAPTFDFNTGAESRLVDVDVQGGDAIRTMCKWKNPTDATVSYGEGTADEMCFSFMMYYPKITTPGFFWYLPSLPVLSSCTSTDE